MVAPLLLPSLAEIRKLFPGVRFKFLNFSTADAVKRLADGLIDFVIVREDAVARPLETRSIRALTEMM